MLVRWYMTQPGRPMIGTVSQVGQHEHGPGKHRCAVGDDAGSGGADGRRRAVVRVDRHAAGHGHHLGPFVDEVSNGVRGHGGVIGNEHLAQDRAAQFRKLHVQHRAELVLDAAVEHLAARGDDADLHRTKGFDLNDRSVFAADRLDPPNVFFARDQGNDAGATHRLVGG